MGICLDVIQRGEDKRLNPELARLNPSCLPLAKPREKSEEQNRLSQTLLRAYPKTLIESSLIKWSLFRE